jgi:hypothetical protein
MLESTRFNVTGLMSPRRNRFVRAGRVAGGVALLAAGVALLILPGPGIPLLAGGLALLAPEFRWARRARSAAMDLVSRVRKRAARAPDPAAEVTRRPS